MTTLGKNWLEKWVAKEVNLEISFAGCFIWFTHRSVSKKDVFYLSALRFSHYVSHNYSKNSKRTLRENPTPVSGKMMGLNILSTGKKIISITKFSVNLRWGCSTPMENIGESKITSRGRDTFPSLKLTENFITWEKVFFCFICGIGVEKVCEKSTKKGTFDSENFENEDWNCQE